MKILVTGAKGFVGKNLCAQLKNIRDGKARNYGFEMPGQAGHDGQVGHAGHDWYNAHDGRTIDEVFEYDLDSTLEELDAWCAEADFVFNLAGVNRPEDASEFMRGNFGFASTLLETLRKHGNTCPVMLASSQQAALAGRFGNSEYGRSKKAGEELFLRYGDDTGAKVLVYRFPNLFGKWCRPNYNSAVATFCHAVANDLPYTVNDPSVELELLYIDDLVDEMIACLRGEEHRCDFDGMGVFPMANGPYCYVPTTHRATLGQIVNLLDQFEAQRKTLVIPEIPAGSFAKKLYSTFLSYLPPSKVAFPLKSNVDARGSFTELLKTLGNGQFSVNVSNPGVTKGQHWHNTKWEFFIVVSGRARIQERRIDSDEVMDFEVSGDCIQAVHMLPGYTHNIINLSDTEPLITLMWANELFDPDRPDTYFEPV